jgi:biotin carboxyl carrier protein
MADDSRARRQAEKGSTERSPAERAADHAAIDRLSGDLLPALVAKLSASGLGEIEVREGAWRIRVRRPATPIDGHARRASDRPSRAQPGHAGHGHPPAAFEGHRSAREGRTGGHSTNGSTPGLTPVGPGEPAAEKPSRHDGGRGRAVATSPAVGIYQPLAGATPGTRVRAGDRLGAVDMLGIAQEVVAPVDGLVGASLVEAGQPVEYGQELVIIELAGSAAGSGGGGPAGAGGAGDAAGPGGDA